MDGDLFHSKDQNKVRLGIGFIEKVKIRYGFRFNPLKRAKQGKSGNVFCCI